MSFERPKGRIPKIDHHIKPDAVFFLIISAFVIAMFFAANQ